LLRQLFGKVPPVYRAINRLRSYRLHEPQIHIDYAFLGSWYGGWTIPVGALTRTSIVYSFGLGEDVSFDLALIERFGCVVHAFDPTPVAVGWLQTQSLPPQFVHHRVGLAERDGDMQFFAPGDSHSFSREPASAATTESVSCPVRRLSSIMSQLGHDHIDLLKMDIEGFEYGVIDDLLESGIRPSIIDIEYHHKSFGIPKERTEASVSKLKAAGYKVYWVSDLGREYGLVLDGAARPAVS
jgi:FkbM family methyltransferase